MKKYIFPNISEIIANMEKPSEGKRFIISQQVVLKNVLIKTLIEVSKMNRGESIFSERRSLCWLHISILEEKWIQIVTKNPKFSHEKWKADEMRVVFPIFYYFSLKYKYIMYWQLLINYYTSPSHQKLKWSKFYLFVQSL